MRTPHSRTLKRARYIHFEQALGRSPDVVLDLTVAEVNGAVGVGGDVGFVGDEHDRVARFVEAFEHAHDFGAGLRVEVAGGLVGQQD